MEAQQVQSGRGVQGLRAVLGGGHVGAREPDMWRRRHLRHGRTVHAARLAVHSELRQQNC